jgi:5'-3' exonuclease
MGIPSYFKRLTDTYKGIVRRNRVGSVDWLLFDFNCLIYHVLARPDCPVYTPQAPSVWEEKFLNEVAKYTMKVVRHVGPTRGVYIAIDGVAPMAKIRQQRMRRFRAAVEAAETVEPRFDKNAITPGTAFMGALSTRLQELASKHGRPDFKIILSDTTEPGEGEQKLMSFLRVGSACGSDAVVVYGLDADLIVLSLWTRVMHFPSRPMYLFREHVERGAIERDAAGEEVFDWFSIGALEQAITQELGVSNNSSAITDYCAAMMLLGNDFLPTSMSFRLKEEGHQRLIKLLSVGWAAAATVLWCPTEGLNKAGWLAILRQLESEEQNRFARAVIKKLQARPKEDDPEDEPLRQRADEIFVQPGTTQLVTNWRTIYNHMAFNGAPTTIAKAARTYVQGLSWVVDYYTGKPISMEWVYNWHFAPLWSTIVWELESAGWTAPPMPGQRLLKPEEQLGMVLPLASWDLLPAAARIRRLPSIAPEWFPEEFHVQSIGKRFKWECEPEIPIPTPQQVWKRLE